MGTIEQKLRGTPILVAQKVCKEAVIEVAKELLEKYYEPALKNGIIAKYSNLLDTHNNGYEFRVVPFYTFESNPEAEYIGFGETRFKLYPEGYFASDFIYKQARIEGSISFGSKTIDFGFLQVGDKVPVFMMVIEQAIKDLNISLEFLDFEEDVI